MSDELSAKAARLYAERASLNESKGLFQEAISDLDMALSRAPGRADYIARRGYLHLRQRDYDAAERDLDTAVGLVPTEPMYREWRSRLSFIRFRLREALTDVDAAVAARPEDLHLILRRGQMNALLGRGAAAASDRASLAARPGCAAWALWLDGYYHLCEGRFEEASRDFVESAASASPEQADIAEKARFYATAATALAQVRSEGNEGSEEKIGEGEVTTMPSRGTQNEARSTPAAGRLYLCGLGIRPPHQATLEALQALGECDLLFCNMAGDAITEFLGAFCRDIRPIAFRDEADLEPCVRTVLAACAPGMTVGFVTYGHALVFGPLAARLLPEAKSRGLDCRALPSVSSLDHFLAETGNVLGEGYHGFQVYEHRELLEPGFKASARLPSIVFFSNELDKAQLEGVRDALTGVYGKGHKAFVFGGRVEQGPTESMPLADLPSRVRDLDGRRQLFIPPTGGEAA